MRRVNHAMTFLPSTSWTRNGGGAGTTAAPSVRAARARRASGCTAIVVRAGADGVPLTAQNMDLTTFYAPGRVLLDVRPPDGAQQLVLSFAGYLGLTGVSRAGLAVHVNTLMSLPGSTRGLPVAFMVRRLLAHADVASACAFLRAAPHASGQNYVLASRREVVDLEACAKGIVDWGADERAFAHTNHPLVNHHEAIGHTPHPNSIARMAKATADIGECGSLADLEAILADRSAPICHVGSEAGEADTFGAIAVEHCAPPRVRIAPGPPTEQPFVDIPWDDGATPVAEG